MYIPCLQFERVYLFSGGGGGGGQLEVTHFLRLNVSNMLAFFFNPNV